MTTDLRPTRTAPLEPGVVEPRVRTAADVLLAAARYIEEHGWTQGQMSDYETGRVCILGAVYSVSDGDLAHQALAPFYRRLHSLTDWNDAPGRTEAQVIRALRDAAQGGGR